MTESVTVIKLLTMDTPVPNTYIGLSESLKHYQGLSGSLRRTLRGPSRVTQELSGTERLSGGSQELSGPKGLSEVSQGL